MRLFCISIIALGLSISAQAYQPTPGCSFRFHGGNFPIPNLDGYKVVTVNAEFQTVQTFGETQAQYRTVRRPAWDGGPMEYVKTEIRPASKSRAQNKMVRPPYYMIKDGDDQQIGRFDKPADLQDYVCQVLVPVFGSKDSKPK